MSLENEFDRDVAMLAAQTGGILRNIDSRIENPGFEHRPSNRIELDKFIHAYRTGAPVPSSMGAEYQGSVPEELVRSMAPDTSIYSNPNAVGPGYGQPPAPVVAETFQGINTSLIPMPAPASIPNLGGTSAPGFGAQPLTGIVHTGKAKLPGAGISEEQFTELSEKVDALHHTLKQMNNHLSKMAGMFGKVFCNASKKDLLD